MRNSDRELDIDYEDRISKALFFVEGTVPARFINDTFQNFDGWDWTKASLDGETPAPAKIELQRSLSKPIYKLARLKSNYLTLNRSHRVKVLRLQTPNLPAPCFLDCWHIAKINQKGFFRWDDAGVVKYDSDAIPSQTVIDFNSYVPNYHIMRSANNFQHRQNVPRDADSVYLQIPDTTTRATVESIASQITDGVEPGWNQIEAIVRHMRDEYQLDETSKPDETVEDSVGLFLDRDGGPSWMFATSCTMLLRAAAIEPAWQADFWFVKKTSTANQGNQS